MFLGIVKTPRHTIIKNDYLCRSQDTTTMPIIEIDTLTYPGVEVYSALTENQLRNKLDPSKGIFIAESPKVIKAALDAGCKPISLLCEKKHIEGDAAEIILQHNDIPVYTGCRELLRQITGYTLTRGVLCAMQRPCYPPAEQLCQNARRIVVLDNISDTTNIGSIFRSAAALGIDAVLLTPTSCDPLNRRAVRVSMGTIFMVPWTRLMTPIKSLRNLGFKTVAMALRDNALPINDVRLINEEKLAIIMGAEGDGLDDGVINEADYVVRIPMSNKVDSLNVGAAAAVAFWQLR